MHLKRPTSLNIVLLSAAVLLALPATGAALHVFETGRTGMRLAAAIAVGALAVTPLVFVFVRSDTWKRRAAYVMTMVLAVELLLQLMTLTGLMPGINVLGHVPYGRVYWTSEGRANGTMNGCGWYANAFPPRRETRRIALIGDSLLEGLQVPVHQTTGSQLAHRFERSGSAQVLSLGLSGSGPAQYVEVLRYAHRTLGATEAVIFVHLGNDFTDVLGDRGVKPPPDQYIVYHLDAAGRLTLSADAERARQRFRRRLRWNHAGAIVNLPRTARTHLLLPRVAQSLVRMTRRRPPPPGPEASICERMAAIGLLDFAFRKDRPPEAIEAARVVTALLTACSDDARRNNVRLRVVTIPKWPLQLYDADAGRVWTSEIDGYDFLLPDRDIAAWAAANDVPFLSLGERMAADPGNSERIRALFLQNGAGHFSPAGHAWTARVVAEFLTAEVTMQ